MTPFEGNNSVIPPVNTLTEQKEREQAKASRKLFFVLFEDTGTEKDKIISESAAHFYQFSKEALAALEVCETETLSDEQPVIEKSGVKALGVFEVPDNIDLESVAGESVSHIFIKEDAEQEKSLTQAAG